MRIYLLTLMFAIVSLMAYAEPHCPHFNNEDNKATIIFTDEDAEGEYIVSDVKLIPISDGKGYEPVSVTTTVTDGIATVTLTFNHLTKFSNPVVELSINGKKTKFNVFKLHGIWKS